MEARDRTGGRIYTNRDWGTPLELGANWISYAHDPKNLVWGLRSAAGIETRKSSYDDVKIYDADGDNLQRLRSFLFYRKFEKRKKPIIAELLRSNTDISVAQCIQEMFASEELSTTEQVLLETIKSGYATDIGDDLTDISTLQYLVNEQEADDEHLVVNGYDRLIKLLLTGINVQLNQPVREIKTQSNRVEVVTDHTALEGDYVLVTTPISILQQRKIIFSPPLPAFKTTSFSKLSMGLFNKVVMCFTDKFWSGNSDFYVYQNQLQKSAQIMLNGHHFTDQPMLVAFHIGQSGKWVEEHSPETVAHRWQEMLHQAYPHREIAFEKIMTSSWCSDPYALGSYAHMSVGTVPTAFDAIAEPVGRIHFAGEATVSAFHGYVHGAHFSGIREANRIIGY